MLQHGARQVYAIDVGQGILDWKLRQDPRVVFMEESNARFIERLPQPVSLVTIEASFISLKILLPVVQGWLPSGASGGVVIALVKPQFEAGRALVGRGKGVIRPSDSPAGRAGGAGLCPSRGERAVQQDPSCY